MKVHTSLDQEELLEYLCRINWLDPYTGQPFRINMLHVRHITTYCDQCGEVIGKGSIFHSFDQNYYEPVAPCGLYCTGCLLTELDKLTWPEVFP